MSVACMFSWHQTIFYWGDEILGKSGLHPEPRLKLGFGGFQPTRLSLSCPRLMLWMQEFGGCGQNDMRRQQKVEHLIRPGVKSAAVFLLFKNAGFRY